LDVAAGQRPENPYGMHTPSIVRMFCICFFAANLGMAADQADFEITNPAIPGYTLRFPVYPFDALIHNRTGAANLKCLVDKDGLLIRATAESGDPDFVGASVAFIEAMALDVPPGTKRDDEGRAIVPFEVVYDLGKCDGKNTLMSCPPKSARRILAALQKDPSGKQFSTLKSLDGPVTPLVQKEPFFPAMLRGKVKQGQALIEFFIDQTGHSVLPNTISATDDAFGYSACQAISEWRFKPPLRGGKPTDVRVRIPINFTWKE
jgi:TonB family protein